MGVPLGVEWILLGLDTTRERLAQMFSWLAATAVGYSFQAAGHALVLGQDESQ